MCRVIVTINTTSLSTTLSNRCIHSFITLFVLFALSSHQLVHMCVTKSISSQQLFVSGSGSCSYIIGVLCSVHRPSKFKNFNFHVLSTFGCHKNHQVNEMVNFSFHCGEPEHFILYQHMICPVIK